MKAQKSQTTFWNGRTRDILLLFFIKSIKKNWGFKFILQTISNVKPSLVFRKSGFFINMYNVYFLKGKH